MELALTGTVWVTVVLLGLFLTEIHFAGLKVHEAAAFAAFQVTRQSALDVSTTSVSNLSNLTDNTGGSPSGQALARFQDFSGLAANAAQSGSTQVAISASGLNVTCTRDTALDLARGTTANSTPAPWPDPSNLQAQGDHQSQLNNSPEYRQLVADLDAIYPTPGGVTCTASATVSALRAPIHFLDGPGGLFRVQNLVTNTLTLCSPGRAVNGQCIGGYGVLAGDFGLDVSPSAGDAARDCELERSDGTGSCANRTYQAMVAQLYADNVDAFTQTKPASSLAGIVNDGTSPIDETRFFMSFAGGESRAAPTPYLDGWRSRPMAPAPTVDRYYNTSGAWSPLATRPTQDNPPTAWNGCWLGLDGC